MYRERVEEFSSGSRADKTKENKRKRKCFQLRDGPRLGQLQLEDDEDDDASSDERLSVLRRRWARRDVVGGARPNDTFLAEGTATADEDDDSETLASSDRWPNWMAPSWSSCRSSSRSASMSMASGSWPRPESSSRLRSRASSATFMLMCCMTTRLTAMALSANTDSSCALLFLRNHNTSACLRLMIPLLTVLGENRHCLAWCVFSSNKRSVYSLISTTVLSFWQLFGTEECGHEHPWSENRQIWYKRRKYSVGYKKVR